MVGVGADSWTATLSVVLAVIVLSSFGLPGMAPSATILERADIRRVSSPSH